MNDAAQEGRLLYEDFRTYGPVAPVFDRVIDVLAGVDGAKADLLLRGVDDDLLQSLKKSAGSHGRS